MPNKIQVEACIKKEEGVLVFYAPNTSQDKFNSESQIIDLFSLEIATGYEEDENGRLKLHTEPFVEEGITWPTTKAIGIIRAENQQQQWIALQKDKSAWALFMGGGGLQHCKKLLLNNLRSQNSTPSQQMPNDRPKDIWDEAITPVITSNIDQKPKKPLEKQLTEKPSRKSSVKDQDSKKRYPRKPKNSDRELSLARTSILKAVIWTSLAWFALLLVFTAGFLTVFERQDRRLDLILQRLESYGLKKTNQI